MLQSLFSLLYQSFFYALLQYLVYNFLLYQQWKQNIKNIKYCLCIFVFSNFCWKLFKNTRATIAFEKKLKKQLRTCVYFKTPPAKNAFQNCHPISKKQPCPTINSKITTKFFGLFKVSKMTTNFLTSRQWFKTVTINKNVTVIHCQTLNVMQCQILTLTLAPTLILVQLL